MSDHGNVFIIKIVMDYNMQVILFPKEAALEADIQIDINSDDDLTLEYLVLVIGNHTMHIPCNKEIRIKDYFRDEHINALLKQAQKERDKVFEELAGTI